MTDADYRAPHHRFALGAGVLAGVASLAGCTDVIDEPGSEDDQIPTESTSPSTTPGRDDPPLECSDIDQLKQEISQLEQTIEGTDGAIEQVLQQHAELEGQIAEFVGYADSEVTRAEQVAQTVMDSVLFLDTGRGTGTAWFIEPGHVITNSHNVADSQTGEAYDGDLTGYLPDGTSISLTLEAHVPSMRPDLAYLTTDYTEVAGLDLATSSTLQLGEPLVMVGHPGGVGEWVVSMGLLVERHGGHDGIYELRTTVPGRQGNSGSPVLTLDGDVIGIHYASRPRTRSSELDSTGQPVAPEPDDPFVYDWELAPRAWGMQVASEEIARLYSDWS